MDISAYINHHEILRETLAGINKIFIQAGEGEIIHTEATPSFEGLINTLFPVLDKLYHLQHQNFLALLYRVDINESMLEKAMEKKGELFIREVAALVVKRELQKAVSRSFYKNQQ